MYASAVTGKNFRNVIATAGPGLMAVTNFSAIQQF